MPPPMPPLPKGNKTLIKPYKGIVVVNNPLVRLSFFGEMHFLGAVGGILNFP